MQIRKKAGVFPAEIKNAELFRNIRIRRKNYEDEKSTIRDPFLLYGPSDGRLQQEKQTK